MLEEMEEKGVFLLENGGAGREAYYRQPRGGPNTAYLARLGSESEDEDTNAEIVMEVERVISFCVR